MEKWQPQNPAPKMKSQRSRTAKNAPRKEAMIVVPVEAPCVGSRSDLLAARWPALGEALLAHQRNVAAAFAQEAYHAVEQGVIRQEERRRLSARAGTLGIRPFDAELLMACALRDWATDQTIRQRISPEAKRERTIWTFWIAAATLALVLDVIVVALLFR